MKVFIKEDISDYGDFNDSVGKIYDCKLEECTNYDEQQYRKIKFEHGILSNVKDIIYITINDSRIEYDSIQESVLLFENDVEFAHYLIDNNEGFATSIVDIYSVLK